MACPPVVQECNVRHELATTQLVSVSVAIEDGGVFVEQRELSGRGHIHLAQKPSGMTVLACGGRDHADTVPSHADASECERPSMRCVW